MSSRSYEQEEERKIASDISPKYRARIEKLIRQKRKLQKLQGRLYDEINGRGANDVIQQLSVLPGIYTRCKIIGIPVPAAIRDRAKKLEKQKKSLWTQHDTTRTELRKVREEIEDIYAAQGNRCPMCKKMAPPATTH